MTFFLSAAAIIISILAIFVNQWITFIPQLGIGFQYHRRRVQIVVAIAAIGLALWAYLIQPSTAQLVVLFIVIALTPLSGFNHAKKTLVALDHPQYIQAPRADFADDAKVVGYAPGGDAAYAWPLEMLIPHHLVNDEIEGEALLVCW